MEPRLIGDKCESKGEDMDGRRLLVPRVRWREEQVPSSCVEVVSWNALRRNYRFVGNNFTKREHREWEHRLALIRSLLVEEASRADFLALQEIELLEDLDFLKGAYDVVGAKAKEGQHSLTKPRLYFRRDKWTLLWEECRSRVVMAGFKRRDTDQVVCVWSVHLQGGQAGAAERTNQIKSALKHMSKHTKGAVMPSLICGDFNTTELVAFEGMTNMMAKHGISFPTHIWGDKNEQYPSTIDQVYASDAHFSLLGLRDPFTPEQWTEAKEVGLPNAFHPSDHLPLIMRFSLVEE